MTGLLTVVFSAVHLQFMHPFPPAIQLLLQIQTNAPDQIL